MSRQAYIARSIVLAITQTAINNNKTRSRGIFGAILAVFSAVFSVYQLALHKIRPADFAYLRRECWGVDDDAYVESFLPGGGEGEREGGRPEDSLKPIGDMGFSGSTFYATADQKHLVKSVPRHSEHSFFRDDLLTPYVEHMAQHPLSLLVRICDFLAAPRLSLGRIVRAAPSHHIVMDNITYGQRQATGERGASLEWEQWDLKPTSYFYPERDIADGRLATDAAKSQLADELEGKILLDRAQADSLFAILDADTELLARHNAVDYSLFLVRMQTTQDVSAEQEQEQEQEQVADPGSSASARVTSGTVPHEPPAVPPLPPSWRTGVPSADGKFVYRAAVLDFFWAKHKAQPRLMTLLIKLWNALVSRQGHMSITTTPEEYRQRFLRMCRSYVAVKEDVAPRAI